jgi:hypothetical protein
VTFARRAPSGTPSWVRPRDRAPILALACAIAGLSACGAAHGRPAVDPSTGDSRPAPAPSAGHSRLFAPNSVWNRALAANAPIAPDSRSLVGTLQLQVHTRGTWINTDQFSVPLVTVGARQRPVRVRLDTRYPPLARAFARVPVPNGAQPAAGSDRHLVVWQPSTDSMWEFWHMQPEADGWHARWGAKIANVSRSPGVVPAPEGATASGLALAAGLMTTRELQRGQIDHALAVALPSAAPGVVSAPANRTDGSSPRRAAIPLGTHFRLVPRVDVDALGLPPAGRTIARALQRYGMVARDTSGSSVSFYAQAPPPGQPRIYHSVFHGVYRSLLLARFPWNRMQVVRTPLRRVTGRGG